jgi:hypothetical protein
MRNGLRKNQEAQRSALTFQGTGTYFNNGYFSGSVFSLAMI